MSVLSNPNPRKEIVNQFSPQNGDLVWYIDGNCPATILWPGKPTASGEKTFFIRTHNQTNLKVVITDLSQKEPVIMATGPSWSLGF